MTVPGTEWSRAISCVTDTDCILIAANTSSPLNGDADTLVPMKMSGGLGDPVNIKGMTEAVAIGCDPGLASRCIVAGDSGGIFGTITGKFISVGPPVNGKPKLYQVRDTPGIPAAVSCVPGSSTCVLAEDSGAQVVRADGTSGTWSAYAGLHAQSVACSAPLPRPSATHCLILTSTGFVTFAPGTGTFGTLQPWASVSFGAKVACYPTASSCVAFTNDPVSGNTIVADVSLSTGKVEKQYPVSSFTGEGLTCFSASGCLAAGDVFGAHTTYPGILIITGGIPQGLSTVINATESNGLADIACAGQETVDCLAAGAEGTTSQPGIPTVGMLLPLTTGGKTRSWSPGNPTDFYQRYAIGVIVATGPTNDTFIECTATVVISEAQDLIITAAHCVTNLLNGTNQLYKNIYFAPDHSGPICQDLKCGINPVGVWTGQTSDITVWTGKGGVVANQRMDWAFVKVHPTSGELPVQRVTGGMEINFNPSYAQPWKAYGYPYGNSLGGKQYADKFVSCSGNSVRWTSSPSGGGPDQIYISNTTCNVMIHGASGGPWFDSNGRVGAVNKASNPGLLGTYLGDEAQAGYKQAGGG